VHKTTLSNDSDDLSLFYAYYLA